MVEICFLSKLFKTIAALASAAEPAYCRLASVLAGDLLQLQFDTWANCQQGSTAELATVVCQLVL